MTGWNTIQHYKVSRTVFARMKFAKYTVRRSGNVILGLCCISVFGVPGAGGRTKNIINLIKSPIQYFEFIATNIHSDYFLSLYF